MGYTLGSLFDGSGGFPLAASLCGIEPVWASEVEPYPIAVTRSRFPGMKHLGDVSRISGAEIEPADVITFGSPCQDLSVAGKRAGLKHEEKGDDETTRSGLFMEAVRIIKEMREATNGRYPTFALWENVPGAFSSNRGEDFRTVCEKLIRIVEPSASMPPVPAGGWAYADSYVGDGWSLAYRVFDAQYWGVPQRRRRIHLVLDLRGGRAEEILFEREGLRGYFAEGRAPWAGFAADAPGRAGADDRRRNCLNPWDRLAERCYSVDDFFPTLRAGERSGQDQRSVCYCIQGAVIGRSDTAGPCGKGYRDDEVAYTIDTKAPSVIAFAQNQRNEIRDLHGIAGSLAAQPGMKQQTYIAEQYLFENHSQDTRYKGPLDVCPMLPAQLGTGGNNTPFVVETAPGVYCMATQQGGAEVMENKCPTITASAGMSGNNQPVICMAHGQANAEVLEDKSPCLNCNHEQPIVFDKEVYNSGAGSTGGAYISDDGISPTIRTEHPPGVCSKFIVRRLTPTECARLQGFPDHWGRPDVKDDFTEEEYQFWCGVVLTKSLIDGSVVITEDGKLYTAKGLKPYKAKSKQQMLRWYNKLHTDSSEYKMWGNGIALPTALYCMQGIADALARNPIHTTNHTT